MSQHDLLEYGAIDTAREIVQQPAKWRELAEHIQSQAGQIRSFLRAPLAEKDLLIVFIGAGTSAYAGGIAAASVTQRGRYQAVAIPTTDLVEDHASFLDPDRPTLVVSLARSGESPESIAACRIVDAHLRSVWHVVLTCNEAGRLAQEARAADRLCLVMPSGTNDAGFAMTSSFSCLALAAMMVVSLDDRDATVTQFEHAARLAQTILDRHEDVAALARVPHSRVVYLGAGAMKAAATEAALKLMELSNGDVAASSETPLAFRHGPKALVNGAKTLVVGFVNANPPASAYCQDMLAELERDAIADVLAVGPKTAPGGVRCFPVDQGETRLEDGWLAVVYVTFSQLLGFFTSLHLGHRPDDPCPSRQVNRVVQNVTIYAEDVGRPDLNRTVDR